MKNVIDFVCEKLDNIVKELKKQEPHSDKDIILACLRYCRHRLIKHPKSGIHFALSNADQKQVDNIIENLSK